MTAVTRLRGGEAEKHAPRHFMDLSDIDSQSLRTMLELAAAMKRGAHPAGTKPLAGRTLAMIFEKPSTRTRVSFEVAMRQLGGDVINLAAGELQTSRGETLADTARVLSRYVDAIMMRTYDVARIQELAEHATVPVINGLTNNSHPCQLMADVMTFEEFSGPIAGKTIAWVGDGNNVARSYLQAAARFGFRLRMATPESLRPPAETVAWAHANGAEVELMDDADAAVRGADCIVTDTWVSMNDAEGTNRHNLLKPYQVNARLMQAAGPQAIVMHCLPAHRGEEITDEVMDGPQSVVFDEAENRLHAQKGILAWCLLSAPATGARPRAR
jgi:ornithine carbamoyltransferase